ncbi:hypothetical protein POM88_043161 [Heracleum sosnowskyi]|uniref:Uncharacterized protein n=1 Tax=Heracleum sosnowskyi TaxID=360622 RepID=A0AAD8H0G9_9APIA|nr:hypothetical protein POM88_043161 [Heracleum sosnowskyi]
MSEPNPPNSSKPPSSCYKPLSTPPISFTLSTPRPPISFTLSTIHLKKSISFLALLSPEYVKKSISFSALSSSQPQSLNLNTPPSCSKPPSSSSKTPIHSIISSIPSFKEINFIIIFKEIKFHKLKYDETKYGLQKIARTSAISLITFSMGMPIRSSASLLYSVKVVVPESSSTTYQITVSKTLGAVVVSSVLLCLYPKRFLFTLEWIESSGCSDAATSSARDIQKEQERNGTYYSGPTSYGMNPQSSEHLLKMPQSSAVSSDYGWAVPPPPPPMGHSSDMSSSDYSGPRHPPMPPPHPALALGFNKSTFTYDELAAATYLSPEYASSGKLTEKSDVY